MTVIRRLASSGITVCATIHAPTHYVFSQCDRLLMLLRGKLCYFGRNGGWRIERVGGQAAG